MSRDDGYYDLGQVCENGHAINGRARDYPAHNENRCSKCGARTLTSCPSCKTEIRGEYDVPSVAIIGGSYVAPAFCHECGHPYPWTAAGLRAAERLADEIDGLAESEKTLLKASLSDLIRDTPDRPVAETRFRRIMQKAGGEAARGMRAVLTNVVNKQVMETLFGS